jgi:hypothetical protein
MEQTEKETEKTEKPNKPIEIRREPAKAEETSHEHNKIMKNRRKKKLDENLKL